MNWLRLFKRCTLLSLADPDRQGLSKKKCFEPFGCQFGLNTRVPGPGEVLPYKGLIGTSGQPGYVFRDFCIKQGIDFNIFCLNQGIDLSISVLNRVSFLGR